MNEERDHHLSIGLDYGGSNSRWHPGIQISLALTNEFALDREACVSYVMCIVEHKLNVKIDELEELDRRVRGAHR